MIDSQTMSRAAISVSSVPRCRPRLRRLVIEDFNELEGKFHEQTSQHQHPTFRHQQQQELGQSSSREDKPHGRKMVKPNPPLSPLAEPQPSPLNKQTDSKQPHHNSQQHQSEDMSQIIEQAICVFEETAIKGSSLEGESECSVRKGAVKTAKRIANVGRRQEIGRRRQREELAWYAELMEGQLKKYGKRIGFRVKGRRRVRAKRGESVEGESCSVRGTSLGEGRKQEVSQLE